MSTSIIPTCPACGQVRLPPDEVTLYVDTLGVEESRYEFNCPRCHEKVTKVADDRIVRLLTSGGVPVRDVGRNSAPPFTRDDVR